MLVINDFNTSVEKALSEIDPKWRNYHGLIVCGSHTPLNIEMIINNIQVARETNEPFLGICFGHQLAAIEYARNVLGITDATSEEFGKEGTLVIKRRPELKVGLHDGESYWSYFGVDATIVTPWEKAENFITVPYHPEYQSSKDTPHPLLITFLDLCKQG